MSRKERKKDRGNKIHVIPDVLFASAVGIPFVTVDGAGSTAVSNFMAGPGNWQYIPNDIIGGITENVKPIAELVVSAFVAKYLGKKLGLNRVGTKEVKLL